jgi:hypothetical protein
MKHNIVKPAKQTAPVEPNNYEQYLYDDDDYDDDSDECDDSEDDDNTDGRKNHKKTELDRALLQFMVGNNQPLSLVECPLFKKFCELLGYKPPCRKTISNVLLPEYYEEVKFKLCNVLKETETCAIACDPWTSNANIGFNGTIGHFIDENYNLTNVVLAQRYMQSDHTSEYLKQLTDEILTEFKLTDKVISNILFSKVTHVLIIYF